MGVPSRFAFRLSGVLVILALLLGSSSTVLAAHTIVVGASGTDQSGLCEGDYFKIESTSVLEAGTHTYTGTTNGGDPFSAVLTVTLDSDSEVDTIVVESTDPTYDLIVFGSAGSYDTTEGNTVNGAQAISNVAFCLSDEPPPVIPEAPAAVLLPAVLLAAFGGYLYLSRRRADHLA